MTETSSSKNDHVTIEIGEALQIALKLHKTNSLTEAEQLYRHVLSVAPENLNALHFLGLLCHQQNRKEEAILYIRQIITLSPDNADAHNNLGNILEGMGNISEAEACFRKAISLNPKHGPAHNNLGVVLMAQNRAEEAISAYFRASELSPGSAEFRYNMGNAFRKCGKLETAIEAYQAAVALAPEYAAAWQGLARSYLLLNRREEAAVVFQKWLKKDPGNPVILYLQATLLGHNVPERAPNHYIEQVFDDLANSFDNHLVDKLEYRAPTLLMEALTVALPSPASELDILDAGCGTGLCAPLLKPYARRLVGVDLSAGMLAKARGREAYDDLIQAELTGYLEQENHLFDIIVSADTLCYFGELETVLTAAAGKLRPDGYMAFTLEDAGIEAQTYKLNPHGRYAHSIDYVRRVLENSGLDIFSISSAILRKENREPVTGHVVVSRKRR